jgi:pyrimidine operon attenuation protein/uracil phosphoribosyltransferase
MSNPRLFLSHEEIEITIKRMAHELIENHNDFEDSAILGLQPRGAILAKKIREEVKNILRLKSINYGDLDSTFYRDDFRRSDKPILPNEVNIDFDIQGKRIILVDDVLYTGRSVNAALTALNAYGRPENVELMVLIDRKYNRELPIAPDYSGKEVDTRGDNEKVLVEWKEGNNKVWISSNE